MKRGKYRVYLLIGLLFALTALADKAPRVGSALTTSGDVKVRRNGVLQSVKPGMSLLGGDVIISEKNSRVSIELTSGHIANVGPGSVVSLDEPGAENTNMTSAMLQTGVVSVRKRSSETPSLFLLQTFSTITGAGNASFTVAVAPDGNTRIGVENGSIEVDSDKEKKIKLGVREGIEIDPANKAASKVAEYLPERDNLESWLESRKAAILKNPLPAAKKLTMNLTTAISIGEKLAPEISAFTEKLISEARIAEQARVRGKINEYSVHADFVTMNLPEYVRKLRVLIMLDNRIQARWEVLEWLIKEISAPGSAAPQNAVVAVKKYNATFAQMKVRTNKLHQTRSELLANRIPVLKDAAKLLR